MITENELNTCLSSFDYGILIELVSSDMEASFSDGSEINNNIQPDELCLQPLKSYPGFSQLCNLCIKIFRERQKGESKPHVDHLSTLEESAKRGCRLCNLISECFREHIQGKAITRLNLRYRVGYNFYYVRFDSLSTQHQHSISCHHVDGKS